MSSWPTKNAPVESEREKYSREVTLAIVAHVLICVIIGVVASII